jgi:murein L,D-transpeptidase YafK
MFLLHNGRARSLRKQPRRDNDCRSDGTGTVRQSGSIDLIRASIARALTASAILAGALALAGCFGEDGYELPTRAMKELSPQMLALLQQKNMPKDSPILVRIFKEESELEVWKQDTTGRYQLLKVYPICRWSGDLGPKVHEGDRQAPEGFYTITPGLMNPNSSYYLAINTGFPNSYDKANGRTGALLMIHGDCSSRGCYAMTDEEIGEIYSLARESFLGGQQSFQLQAYPFRMTPLNLARHRTNPNMAFWKMIKEGNDHFEVTHLEPKVEVCNRHYVFDPQQPPGSTKPLVFNPTGPCPAFVVAPEIAAQVLEKQHNDDVQYAQLVKSGIPAAPIRTGLDGGMNRVFLAQVGSIPPARVPNPTLPPQPAPVAASDSGEQSLAGRMLSSFFGSKAATEPTQTASVSAEHEDGGFFRNLFSSKASQAATVAPPSAAREPQKSKIAARSGTGATKPKLAAPSKPEAQEAVAAKLKTAPPRNTEPQQTAAAKTTAASPPQQQQEANAANSRLINGAQPSVPAGSFESRWSGLQ